MSYRCLCSSCTFPLPLFEEYPTWTDPRLPAECQFHICDYCGELWPQSFISSFQGFPLDKEFLTTRPSIRITLEFLTLCFRVLHEIDFYLANTTPSLQGALFNGYSLFTATVWEAIEAALSYFHHTLLGIHLFPSLNFLTSWLD